MSSQFFSEPIHTVCINFSDSDFNQIARIIQKIQPASEIEKIAYHEVTFSLLKNKQYDVICLCVDTLFPRAVRLIQTVNHPDPIYPFILFGKETDIETAVSFMQAGAADYLPLSRVTFNSLQRAIKNVIDINSNKRQKIAAEKALRESEERYRTMFESLLDIYFQTLGWKIDYS